MRAALAAREDKSFVVVGRTSAAEMSGIADAVAP
jgi:2-methylisocitrate lyase-like PEP mutase family enzyme